MTIDMTATLMPFVWALPMLLAISALAIVGSIVVPHIRSHWAARSQPTLPMAPRPALTHPATR